MRKLKVQMNFGGINWDDDMVTFCIDNLKKVDSILLGRVTAEALIAHWKKVRGNPDPNDFYSRLLRLTNVIGLLTATYHGSSFLVLFSFAENSV